MADSPSGDRLLEALRLLAAEARQRLDRAGDGVTRPTTLELVLRLPLPALPEGLARAREALDESLQEEIRSLAARATLLRPGNVLCLRCGSAECAHAAPPDPRYVLAGYGPTGLPRFLDLPQLLLERGDPRAEALFAKRPGIVALVLSADELTAQLLPAYRRHFGPLRLHGQVAAGWYPVPGGEPGRDVLTASFQVLSVGRRRNLRLVAHPVGAAGDEALGSAMEAGGERAPWSHALSWTRAILARIEAEARRGKGLSAGQLAGRLDGVLLGFGVRLERPSRARRRQTAHAERRHRGGSRPTGAALADLFDAPVERILRDARHGTYVTLGPKGRTHVFTPAGKLVTSVRYGKESIDKKQRMGEWRPASPAEARELVARVREAVGRAG